jgi:hypothetical protein
MPTIWRELGFRFSFYSADGEEPPHVHVTKDGCQAKWWIGTDPAQEARSEGFAASDRAKIARIITRERGYLLDRWWAYFGPK